MDNLPPFNIAFKMLNGIWPWWTLFPGESQCRLLPLNRRGGKVDPDWVEPTTTTRLSVMGRKCSDQRAPWIMACVWRRSSEENTLLRYHEGRCSPCDWNADHIVVRCADLSSDSQRCGNAPSNWHSGWRSEGQTLAAICCAQNRKNWRLTNYYFGAGIGFGIPPGCDLALLHFCESGRRGTYRIWKSQIVTPSGRGEEQWPVICHEAGMCQYFFILSAHGKSFLGALKSYRSWIISLFFHFIMFFYIKFLL